jgi:uncharacterized protein (TIGR00730 family)
MPELSLCVFCGTNTGSSPAYMRAATDLGTAMAERGIALVYGGGKLGLMGAVADAVLAGGGHVTGVIPQSLMDAEVGHRGVSVLEVTDSMHSRKARMAEIATGFIALPGGFGTYEEVLEVLTWNQLGFIHKPVVLVDIDGFYAPLFAMFDHGAQAGFVRPAHVALAQRALTIADALDRAVAAAPATETKWSRSVATPTG